jgi:hypothetical protein
MMQLRPTLPELPKEMKGETWLVKEGREEEKDEARRCSRGE